MGSSAQEETAGISRACSLAGRKAEEKQVGRWTGQLEWTDLPSDCFQVSEKEEARLRMKVRASVLLIAMSPEINTAPAAWLAECLAGEGQLHPMTQHFLVVWFCAISMFGTFTGLGREKMGYHSKAFRLKFCVHIRILHLSINVHIHMLYMHKSRKQFK